MRATVQRASPLQAPGSSGAARQGMAPFRSGPGRESTEDRSSEPAATAWPFWGPDFSRTPILPPRQGLIQAKLASDQLGDEHEREADRVAAAVTTRSGHGIGGGPPLIRDPLRASQTVADLAPSSVGEVLARPGMPLEPSVERDMGLRFMHDFSRVRVHCDAAAAKSADDIHAHAYTAGHNIVFARGAFEPGTPQGRRLIAHELTHVVQQSQAGARLQRSPKEEAKKAVPDKVAAAKENLKAKYDLGDITEERGASWSEAELKNIDAAFSKLSPDDKKLLKGIELKRADKLSLRYKGKEIKLDAETFPGGTIEFTHVGTTGITPIHEVGHAVQNRVLHDAEEKMKATKPWTDLETARLKVNEAGRKSGRVIGSDMDAAEFAVFNAAIGKLNDAAGNVLGSSIDTLKSNREALNAAVDEFEALAGSGDKALLASWKDYVVAIDKWMTAKESVLGPKRKLAEFVDIVKKNGLARPGFKPFTPYVEKLWRDKPEEFFAQSFAIWSSEPNYMFHNAKPLYDWFQAGRHRPPEPTKGDTPVFDALATAMDDTFRPALEGAAEIIKALGGSK